MKNKLFKIFSLSTCILIPMGFVTSCSSSSSLNDVKWIGHRGVPGKIQGDSDTPQVMENTYDSYKAACEYKGDDSYWGIETDVYPTTDNKCVCVHDSTCFRKNDGSRDINTKIYDCTLEQAQSKNLLHSSNYPRYFDGFFDPYKQESSKTSNYHACALEDYLKLCKDYNKTAVIEIKQDGINMDADDPTRETGSIWNTSNLPGLYNTVKNSRVNFCFISFDNAAIDWLQKTYPSELNSNNLQMIYDPLNSVEKFRDFNWFLENNYSVDVGDALSMSTTDWGVEITEDLVNKFHEKNLMFNVWTIDTLDRAEELADMGVDFITSDYARSTIPTTYLGK